MRWIRRLAPRIAVSAAVLLLLVAAPAAAQQGFRITHETDTSRPGRVRVTGTVANEHQTDVFEVSVTAEALNDSGKVVAKGIAYVDSRIPRGASRQFSIAVPAAPNVVRYRVVVSTYRAGLGGESP